jgi:hypothetical protein
MTVVVLEDAASDLESGKRFYDSRELGVGDYFTESLLSDLNSLVLYAGRHSKHFGFHRMLSVVRWLSSLAIALAHLRAFLGQSDHRRANSRAAVRKAQAPTG